MPDSATTDLFAIPQEEGQCLHCELIEISPNAIAIHVGGSIQFTNGAALALFRGNSSERIVGRSVLQSVHPDDPELVRKHLRITDPVDGAVPRIYTGTVYRIRWNGTLGEVATVPFLHIR